MLATFAFDVCHDVYRAAREAIDGKIATLNLESSGKYSWHPDRMPRLSEYVCDFARAGERALTAGGGVRASRVVMFRLFYLGGAEYESARRELGVSEGTWADWAEEIRGRVGKELTRAGIFPPSRYFRESSLGDRVRRGALRQAHTGEGRTEWPGGWMPVEAITGAPHAGYAITIEVAEAPSSGVTPDPLAKLDGSRDSGSFVGDPFCMPEHAALDQPADVLGEASEGCDAGPADASSPAYFGGGECDDVTVRGGDGGVRSDTNGVETDALGAVEDGGRMRAGGGSEEGAQTEVYATEGVRGARGQICFDSVDSELETAELRHVTQLATQPVVVDRPGGRVRSERELRLVIPLARDAGGELGMDEAAAVAVEFGVLRGLLDLVSPAAVAGQAGITRGAPRDDGRGSAGTIRSKKKWWGFGVVLMGLSMLSWSMTATAAPRVRACGAVVVGCGNAKGAQTEVYATGRPVVTTAAAGAFGRDAAPVRNCGAVVVGCGNAKGAQTEVYATGRPVVTTVAAAGAFGRDAARVRNCGAVVVECGNAKGAQTEVYATGRPVVTTVAAAGAFGRDAAPVRNCGAVVVGCGNAKGAQTEVYATGRPVVTTVAAAGAVRVAAVRAKVAFAAEPFPAQGQFATGGPEKITDGTNTLVVDPCKGQTRLFASINQTGNTQLVSGTTSKKIYICSVQVVVAAATGVALVEGTGSVCGTGTAGVSGFGGATAATGWNFAANGGIAYGNGEAAVGAEGTAADNLCLFNSGSGQVSGGIGYVVQ